MGASLRWTVLSLAVLCLLTLARGGSVSHVSSSSGGGSNNASCGTCESLGYQCLGANAPKDACGQAIDVGGCAIPSCATYCLVMAGLSGGFCNDNTHWCVCDPDAVVSTGPTPVTGTNTQDEPDVMIQASPGSGSPEATPTPALVPKVFHFGAGAIGGTVTQASIAAIAIVALGIVAAGKSG